MISILKKIFDSVISSLKNGIKINFSGRNSTNIIGHHNTVNNGQIIEIDEKNESITINKYGERNEK